MTITATPRHTISQPSSTRSRSFGTHGGRLPARVGATPTHELPRQLSSAPSAQATQVTQAPQHREHTDLGETYLLAQAVRRVAVTPRLWRAAIRFETEGPYAVRVPGPKGVDVWLRTWLPGQRTGLVDLGSCATAFAVVQGSLDDVRADEVLGTWITHLPFQSVRIIEPGVVHDLRGGPEGHTVSIHAYSPRLRSITEHSWDDGRLSRRRTVTVAAPWQDPRVASA
jgi:hypothetical protein